MNLSEILDSALRTQTPLLLWGPPGIGKSASIRKWAMDRSLSCWVVIASLRDPSDFGGLPIVSHSGSNGDGYGESNIGNGPVVSFAPPRFAVEASKEGGLIFLDELTTAPPAVQAALLRAVLDKAFGDLALDPSKVAIVAAANPPEDAACGWDLAPPLANRFLHIDYKVNVQEWLEGFPGYWGSPPELSYGIQTLSRRNWSNVRATVAGFIRSRPNLLLQIPKNESQRGKAWPSPRTWDFFSRMFAVGREKGIGEDGFLSVGAGCVGEGAAHEFMIWHRQMDLPDPEELLEKPIKYRHPKRGDQAYAVLSAVVQAAMENLTELRWLNAWKILAKAADKGSPDVAAAPARNLARAYEPTFPMPEKELEAFGPLLRAAGLLGKTETKSPAKGSKNKKEMNNSGGRKAKCSGRQNRRKPGGKKASS